MQNDGTEGNHAYYGGNLVPHHDSYAESNTKTLRPFQSEALWGANPYWKYFQKVWGNAPFAESNFRLWLHGYFKNFKMPRKAQKFQETQALPAFLHYYGKAYDPLLDPPYASEFDLFGSGSEGGGSESAQPPPIDGDAVRADCSHSPFKNAMGFKRPCGINEVAAKSWTKAKVMMPLKNVLGRNTWWEGKHRTAGGERGTAYFTYNNMPASPLEEGEQPWIGLDDSWANGGSEERPKNIPAPPKEREIPSDR